MVAPSEKLVGTRSRGEIANEQLFGLLMRHGPKVRVFFSLAFAVGLSDEQVAKLFREEESVVNDFREDPATVDLTTEIQVAMNFSAEKRLQLATQRAVDVKMRLLSIGDDKLKDKVATDIIERNFGKPVQTTQNLNANINVNTDVNEIDTRLDQVNERLRVLAEKRAKIAATNLKKIG
jgi:hypothetical protein